MTDAFLVALQHVTPQRALSRLVGWLAQRRAGALTRLAILWFTRAYGVALSEASSADVDDYPTFNAFFTRALRDDARPLPRDPNVVCAAADGIISECGTIDDGRLLQAKGLDYELGELCGGDAQFLEALQGGSFQTTYLAPRDYHRVHMPLTGRAVRLLHVPGALFSVNAATTRRLPRLFCRNERVAVLFETDHGSFAVVMVGALNVGSIELAVTGAEALAGGTRALSGAALTRGAEFGRFNLGSTVIVIASAGLIAWDRSLAPGITVRMGQAVGRLRATT